MTDRQHERSTSGAVGLSLETIARTSSLFPHVKKEDLAPGDQVLIRTDRSEYRLRVLGGGLYEARGGWFERRGLGPMKVGVAGVTWGGSAIMPGILAACGMRMEFNNRLITSPVQSIVVWPARLQN